MHRGEHLLSREELDRAVKRCLARCEPEGDCLVHPPVQSVPQIRARLRYQVQITVSATRAVYLWLRGQLDDGDDVQRSCANRRCLEPSHLVAAPRGVLVADEARRRNLEAVRRAADARRTYTEAQASLLLALVAKGETITGAARVIGIDPRIAMHIVAGRRGPGGRYLRRGRPGREQCTRCQEHGHRRTSPACRGATP